MTLPEVPEEHRAIFRRIRRKEEFEEICALAVVLVVFVALVAGTVFGILRVIG